MDLLHTKRYLIYFVLIFLISTGLWGYTFESRADSPLNIRTHLFAIQKEDIDKVKELVEKILVDEGKGIANMEVFSVERPSGDLTYLAVRDTPEKLKKIEDAIKLIEERPKLQTVSLNFSDVPLEQILATLARAYNLNIVGGENLSQKVSVHLTDVPGDQVFDIVLKSTGYTYYREGNIIWIISEEAVLPSLVTEVFNLQYLSAEKIKEAISHMLSGEGEVKLFANFGEDKYSDCLVVTDVADSIKAIKEVIEKLDHKPRQVLIEAKFCEVTLDKDDEFGINWVIETSIQPASAPTTFPWGSRGQNIMGRPATITATSEALTMGQLSFQDFSATLKALDSKSVINLVARPYLSARDGEEAEIVIGDRVPIPIYERNETVGSIEITGYQDEDVGTLLRVTPMINNDDTITLIVHPEVSEITGYTGPNNERPIVSTREVTTSFTVENGKTFVLGGLMKNTVSNTYRQIPILGDIFGGIPFFGKLFRFQDDSKDTKELLIFITPTIVEEELFLPEEIEDMYEDSYIREELENR